MKNQKEPKRIQFYEQLAQQVFSPMVGGIKGIKLRPKEMPVDYSKSVIFAANVYYEADQTVRGPSPVVVKHYVPGRPRTSGREDYIHEFKTEKAVLGADIQIRTPFSDSMVRVYPEAYSIDNEECNSHHVIIREFIPGLTLEQIANENSVSSEAPFGDPNISQFILPISILHIKAQEVLNALYANGLVNKNNLKFIKPSEVSKIRTKRVIKYIDRLLQGLGKELDSKDRDRAINAFYILDKSLVSRIELLTTVDGELDVFPHHAMLNRIPDAGGVEIGGLVRDLAVYGAPCFSGLWDSVYDGALKVGDTYINVRGKIEDYLGLNGGGIKGILHKIDMEEFRLGIIFANGIGNLRSGAAIMHSGVYDKEVSIERLEKETDLYLKNGRRHLNALKEGSIGSMRKSANTLLEFSDKYGLGTEDYKISPKYLRKGKLQLGPTKPIKHIIQSTSHQDFAKTDRFKHSGKISGSQI